MTCHFHSGYKGSQLSGSQSQQQTHANSLAHGGLQPYAHPIHRFPPQQGHQTPPNPYEVTPEHQLLKKSTVHSNSTPGGSMRQPWVSEPPQVSSHHHPYPPHATPTSQSHSSASSHQHTANVHKHRMQQERHQSPARYTHSWSDPSKPCHPQPNPSEPPPAIHTHCLSDPTKPPAATGPYPWSDPSKPIPADNGLLTVQQNYHRPLQDATNQQLSFEASCLTPNDPLGSIGPSKPAPAAFQGPLRAAPLPPQEPLAQSRVAPWPHWNPSKVPSLGPHDPLGPSQATPSPPQNPLAPSTASPSAMLSQPPAATAAVAAANHNRVVSDNMVAGSPVTSTHTHCIGAWPKLSQPHNAAPRSQEAHRSIGQAEHMKELKTAPGLQLMLYQWGLPRKVVEVRPVCSHSTNSFGEGIC